MFIKNLECPPYYELTLLLCSFRKKTKKGKSSLMLYKTINASEIMVLMEKVFSIMSLHRFLIRVIYININKISVQVIPEQKKKVREKPNYQNKAI